MIAAGQMDVDYRCAWIGDLCSTLFVSTGEYRDVELAKGLLELGADVNAVSDEINGNTFGILDMIIMGHDCISDKYNQDKVVKMLDLVLDRYTMKLSPFVHKCFTENEWPGFKKNKKICDVVNMYC